VRTPTTVRPLLPGDVPAADAAAWEALRRLIPAEFVDHDEAVRAARGRLRVAHLQATDPQGAWVAEQDGRVVGVALALMRERLWGLSLLAVVPELQGMGIGGRLLAAALSYAQADDGGIILSSTDPRAMRRYHRAGFAARPALDAAGQANRGRVPAGLRSRPGEPDADMDTIHAASRHVRGASHARDIPAMLAADAQLLVLDGRGYAVHREGSPALLAALDDEAARDLLWSCLAAAAPGAPVHIDLITEGNDWALQVALDAGLALSPGGPVFVRGRTGAQRPYLPSGAYL
jgi:predicted N-acetyltransferase YhbS